MQLFRRTRTLLVLSAALIGVAVWVSGAIQRANADRARRVEIAAQHLLTGMLDQETGVRGFLITGREEFLDPYRQGSQVYEDARARLGHELTEGSARERLETVEHAAATWQTLAEGVVTAVREHGPRNAETVAGSLGRKRYFDVFRRALDDLARALERDRDHDAGVATLVAALASIVVALLIGSVGALIIGSQISEARDRRRREQTYREQQSEFVETMQLAEDEAEAHDLLRRHLERSVPGCDVVVLNRNNSHDRLEPTTRVADPDLAQRLEGAEPKSCLAIRLGREQGRGLATAPLMRCELCGANPGATACRPLVVGSEVIGSVLVTCENEFADRDREALHDSVAQAAPALANLRNLALAELRAATDALTGLPNRRAIEDTLKRMTAQASRTMRPVSALMIDVDHFKTINDLYGHEHGDEALAGLGALLRDSLRESDFAGRQGGEEFIVLAPDTDASGAAVLAENLRKAIQGLHLDNLDHSLTASIGVATFPDVAASATGVVRMADRALYLAKERGRNRVEVANGPGPGRPAETAETS